MEAYTTEQINLIILVGAYIFIMGSLVWSYSRPKDTKKKRKK